jgi:DNA-directed RNA polymerase specialized sigma24 family protein
MARWARFRDAMSCGNCFTASPPDAKAEFANECQQFLERLGDETLQTIALLRIEGYSVDEIATRVGCAKRPVERRLSLIRSIWTELAAEGDV